MERDSNGGTAEMLFRDENARLLWNNLANSNKQSEIEREGMNYAIQWVKSMEELVNNGETVESAAEKTFDATLNDASGFTLSLVFCILTRVWEYGEQLSGWRKCRKGIANSAIS